MRERILHAAWSAFMEIGYADTSTLEIATRAKISKRDLYANFAGKQAILLTCIQSRTVRMQLSRDLPLPRNRAMLAGTLTAFGANIIREVSDPAVMAMYRLAIAEAARSPDVAHSLNESRSATRAALAGLFVKAQSAAILAQGDPRELVEQYFALLWGDWLLGGLLGSATRPTSDEIDRRAHAATEAFLKLNAAQTAGQ